ncbi:hypothetical protein ACFLYZ_01890 [Thermodesulfobacteriota bacterium]
MSVQSQLSGIEQSIYAPFLSRLQALYAAMDRNYKEAADYYGFNCTGCEDSCCLTRFYHHTLLEYFYIYEGFKTLGQNKQNKIKQKAAQVCRQTELADEKGQPVRLMCPLNGNGLCLLYAFRPMICRLFGIPHELQQSGAEAEYRPGCAAFSEQCLQKDYFKFDRTPFFRKMAKLEMELKRTVGITQKVKLTVADMFVTF